jgi:hypothetical protein
LRPGKLIFDENKVARVSMVHDRQREEGGIDYLAGSVYKVALQKSVPARIRRVILYHYLYKE